MYAVNGFEAYESRTGEVVGSRAGGRAELRAAATIGVWLWTAISTCCMRSDVPAASVVYDPFRLPAAR